VRFISSAFSGVHNRSVASHVVATLHVIMVIMIMIYMHLYFARSRQSKKKQTRKNKDKYITREITQYQ